MPVAQSDAEAYFCRRQKAHEFTQCAAVATLRVGLPEAAVTWKAGEGRCEAVFGNPSEAHKDAHEALKLARKRNLVQRPKPKHHIRTFSRFGKMLTRIFPFSNQPKPLPENRVNSPGMNSQKTRDHVRPTFSAPLCKPSAKAAADRFLPSYPVANAGAP